MATANGRRRHAALEPEVPWGSGHGISSFLRRHPVTAYYTLVFAISWGGIILTMGPGGMFSTGLTMSIAGGAFLTAGPCVASLILTVVLDGRVGLQRLFSGLRRWRVGLRWYVVALLTGPVVIWGSTLGLSLAIPEFRPNVVPAGEALIIVVAGVGLGLMVGVFEELGWTGFALPRLRRRFSIPVTGLVMGLLWGAWHFPMFGGTADPSGTVPDVVVVAVFLFAWLPPYRVLMVWVYDRTESLLIAVLMHAPISAATFVLASLGSAATSGIPLLIPVLVWGAVLWALIGAVAWVNGGRLTRR
jgi:membrane protease YdiL (CAAX protease family)